LEDPEDRDKDIHSHRTHRPTQVTKLSSLNRSEHQRNMDPDREGDRDLNNRRCLAMQRQLQGRIINQIPKLAPGNRKTRRRRRPKTAAKRDDVTIGIGREAVVEVAAVATSDAADVATLAADGAAVAITAEIIHEVVVVVDIVETAAEEEEWTEATGWIDKIEWIGIIGGIGREVTETEDLDHVVEVVAMESAEDVAADEVGKEIKHQQQPTDTNVSAAMRSASPYSRFVFSFIQCKSFAFLDLVHHYFQTTISVSNCPYIINNY